LKGRNTLGGKTKILSYAREVAYIFNSGEDLEQNDCFRFYQGNQRTN
jgi:hypothetical protein